MPEHSPAPTPSRGIYGFCLHLAMNSLFIGYLLWAVIPEHWFESVGITYLPQRYWAIGVPIFVLNFIAIFAFVIFPCLGLCLTPAFTDLRTITDSRAGAPLNTAQFLELCGNVSECICKEGDECEKESFDRIKMEEDFVRNAVSAIYDLPITRVSEHLYL